MKWHQRALSGVLAAAMGMGLLGGIPQAAAADRTDVELVSTRTTNATGDIQAMIRMDYPLSINKLKSSDAAVALYRGSQKIASGALQEGALTVTDGSAAGTVTWKTTGTSVTSVDVRFTGLSADQGDDQYQLEFTGTGFKTYRSDVLTLDNYSKGLIVGTGDATFTQGDLNGDGKVNEADVELVKAALGTAVTMAAGATGEAKVYQTTAILSKVVDVDQVSQAIAEQIVSGDTASLFTDDGESVRLKAQADAAAIELPIPLAADDGQGVELEQVEIVSSTGNPVEKGVVVAELTDGTIKEVAFDESVPAGVHAMQTRDDGRKVVTISLGGKVPVKKITIKVEVANDQEIVVEQIKFHQDVLPEDPVQENTQVQNVKAQAGSKQVTVSWDVFPNITGYKVYYGTAQNQLTNVVETEKTSCTITDLENLKTYYFAVAPVSNAGGQAWEGGQSDVVSPSPTASPTSPTASRSPRATRCCW